MAFTGVYELEDGEKRRSFVLGLIAFPRKVSWGRFQYDAVFSRADGQAVVDRVYEKLHNFHR